MNKQLLAIALVLAALIAGALWYAQQPGMTVTYGVPTTASEIDAGTSGGAVVDAPQNGTASAGAQAATEAPVVTETPREAGPACESVRVTIEAATYVPCVDAEVTVLAAMQAATADGLVFSGREYPGLGFFVEAINGKKSESGYYWFLYVNGESSSAGASQSLVKPGDVVEWRYKQSY